MTDKPAKAKKKPGPKKDSKKLVKAESSRSAPGKDLWTLVSINGRPRIFESPEDLMGRCIEYFQWVKNNPLMEERVFHYAGEITRTHVTKMRAMTMAGLCVFLGIHHSTWQEYRARAEFSAVVAEVETVMYEQKFTGASADMLNASIISRDLGLVEKSERTGNVNVTIGSEDAECL